MTNEEKIQALKENKMAFGLMPQELQDKAMEIGCKHLVPFRETSTKHLVWDHAMIVARIEYDRAYKLASDYTEEPEEIELEIHATEDSGLVLQGTCFRWKYTDAPAYIPKEGYRFAGYRYKDGHKGLRPVVYSPAGQIIFPTHAVYKKVGE